MQATRRSFCAFCEEIFPSRNPNPSYQTDEDDLSSLIYMFYAQNAYIHALCIIHVVWVCGAYHMLAVSSSDRPPPPTLQQADRGTAAERQHTATLLGRHHITTKRGANHFPRTYRDPRCLLDAKSGKNCKITLKKSKIQFFGVLSTSFAAFQRFKQKPTLTKNVFGRRLVREKSTWAGARGRNGTTSSHTRHYNQVLC